MDTFLAIIISAIIISLFSIIGIFALFLKEKLLEKILLGLVSLSAGAMMGGAFFHLIPEAAEKLEGPYPYLYVVIGFTTFFILEKILHWRHCHKGHCPIHTFGYLNIIGDSIHNFIDGLILAASFLIDFNLGIITALAITLHEIPQEMGDFGVLIYAGFKKIKALVLNYISASTIIIGALLGYFLGDTLSFINILIPFAAGGFIYIASSDLLPELKKEGRLSKFIPSFGVFLLGLALMFLFKIYME